MPARKKAEDYVHHQVVSYLCLLLKKRIVESQVLKKQSRLCFVLAKESLRFSDIELNMGRIDCSKPQAKRTILFQILQIMNKPNGIHSLSIARVRL